MTLEPGLYRATVHGVPDQLVTISTDSADVWALSQDTVAGTRYHPQVAITDARPLIVLDPEALDWPEENRDKTRELARMIRLICNEEGDTYRSAMVRQIADVIDPPKRIPEPGLWGVVEATDLKGHLRSKWVHNRHCWVSQVESMALDWSDLFDPTLIRDGLS